MQTNPVMISYNYIVEKKISCEKELKPKCLHSFQAVSIFQGIGQPKLKSPLIDF